MSVPIRENRYGDYRDEEPNGYHLYKQWWGGETRYTGTSIEELSRRHNHTSNPIQSDGFRRPSIYRRAVRRTEILSGSTARTISGGLGENQISGGAWFWWEGGLRYPGPLFTYGQDLDLAPFSPQREAEALAKVYGRLQRNRVEVGLAVAEIRQTVNMLAKHSIQLLSLLQAVKRGQFSNQLKHNFGLVKKRGARGVHQQFLEYQYGWKPLMSDIHDTYSALTNRLTDLMYLNARGKVEESFDETVVYDQWHHLGFNEFGWVRVERSVSSKRTHRAKLFGKLSNELTAGFEKYGLSNPLSLAWELIPWSFVLDWWIPVGNVLSSLSAHAGLEFIGGFKSVVAEATVNTKLTPLYEWHGPGWEVRTSYYDFTRVPYTDWPYVVPYEKSPFSTTHVANAIALYGSLRK